MDEFANLGRISDGEILISTIRSREISASIILQSLAQLKGFESVPVVGGERVLPSLSKIVHAYFKSESSGRIEEATSYNDIDRCVRIM